MSDIEEYHGSLTLPSEGEPRAVSVLVDNEREAVTVQFDSPAAGSTRWEAASVRLARRLKYSEIVFTTIGLPQETVELIWKLNASHVDGTVAGVIVARPNEVRVRGEKGFTLVKPV